MEVTSTNIIMKTIILLTVCLSGLTCSCSPLGIYYGKHVAEARKKGLERGLLEGRAIEVRSQQEQQLRELEKPQPEHKYYNIPVPASTATDGVMFDAHQKKIKLITR